MRVLLCSALVLSAWPCVGTWVVPIVSDHPVVACPPQWLPVLLASSSHKARRRKTDAIKPGCTAHFVMDDVDGLPDAASMMPAYVTLDGVQIGSTEDGTTQNTTSCDQIAAVANGTVRGTSDFITQGFSVGIIQRMELPRGNLSL